MNDLQLTAETLQDLASSVVSVKVEAIKPKRQARRAGQDKR